MQIGQTQYGMQTFNQSPRHPVLQEADYPSLALSMSSHPDELQDMINRAPGSIIPGRRTRRGRGRLGRPAGAASARPDQED